MIDINIAKEKALEYINSKYAVSGDKLVIRDEYSSENNYGWVFSYQSQLALKGSFRHRLAGNRPVFVSKQDGSICYLPNGFTVDKFVEALHLSVMENQLLGPYRQKLTLDQNA
jgi:hypothetical protein